MPGAYRLVDGDFGRFQFELLDQQVAPPGDQLALKERIDVLLAAYVGPEPAPLIIRRTRGELRALADAGLTGTNPDVAAAASEVERLVSEAHAGDSGPFAVSDESLDIAFRVRPGAQISEDQNKLRADVEDTLTVLRILFPPRDDALQAGSLPASSACARFCTWVHGKFGGPAPAGTAGAPIGANAPPHHPVRLHRSGQLRKSVLPRRRRGWTRGSSSTSVNCSCWRSSVYRLGRNTWELRNRPSTNCAPRSCGERLAG